LKIKLGIFTRNMPSEVIESMKIFDSRVIGLIFFLSCIVMVPAWPQSDFSKKSLDWKYNLKSDIHVNYRIARDDSLYHVYFSIKLPEGGDLENQYSINYEIRSSLDAEELILTRTVNYFVHGLGTIGNLKFFHIEIPDADNFNVMFLNIIHKVSGKSYTWDIPLISETIYPPPDFMLYNKNTEMPECRNYVKKSDLLIIHNLDDRKGEFFVYFYDTDFDVADPPMYRLTKTVSKAMDIHSIFTVSPDSAFILEREGLYFIQSDTSTFSGIGIRVESDLYPRMTSINQLIEPIIYLSTKEEIDKLLNSDNIRTSFEMFWLNLAKSEEGARVVIKNFYDRIEDANLLFTNYKEGWKTDMGMIFTILGPPDEVYRTEGKESWYYKNPGRNQIVVFNFLNLKNLYCDDHYLLIRDNQYKSFWFKGIDNWRKGIN